MPKVVQIISDSEDVLHALLDDGTIWCGWHESMDFKWHKLLPPVPTVAAFVGGRCGKTEATRLSIQEETEE